MQKMGFSAWFWTQLWIKRCKNDHGQFPIKMGTFPVAQISAEVAKRWTLYYLNNFNNLYIYSLIFPRQVYCLCLPGRISRYLPDA
jgi:hypothetical protein